MFADVFPDLYREISRYDRANVVDQISGREETLEKLLSVLQSAPVEHDRFVAHLYQSRREYRRICEKSVKQIERFVISSFQIAESLGFKGEFRQWEDLLD
jgi:hypothetical protein